MAVVSHSRDEHGASHAASSLSQTLLRLGPTAGALLSLCAIATAASFIERDATKNDFERFEDMRLLILFLALFVGLGLVYVRAALQPPVSRMAVLVTALLAAALLFCSMPVGSRDLYLYAFYGKLWATYGTDPYTHTVAEFTADPWQPYVQMQWAHRHMIYGPLFLWQSRLAGWLAGDHLFVSMWTFKTMAVGGLLVVWSLSARFANAIRRQDATSSVMLIAWNPLLLFEIAGNGHNDVMMAALLVAALWCWHVERRSSAMALVALSFWYKWYGLIVLPVLLIDGLKRYGVGATARLLAVCAAALVLVGFATLYWVPGAASEIVAELRNPVVVSQIYPTELSPVLAPWFWLLQATGLLDTPYGMTVFNGGRVVLFAAACLAIVWRQWRLPASTPLVLEGAFLMSFAFSMLLLTILWPWHLVLPVCLGLLTGNRVCIAIAIGLSLAGLLSYFLTLAIAALALVLIAGVLTRGEGGTLRRLSLDTH